MEGGGSNCIPLTARGIVGRNWLGWLYQEKRLEILISQPDTVIVIGAKVGYLEALSWRVLGFGQIYRIYLKKMGNIWGWPRLPGTRLPPCEGGLQTKKLYSTAHIYKCTYRYILRTYSNAWHAAYDVRAVPTQLPCNLPSHISFYLFHFLTYQRYFNHVCGQSRHQ
ncbi:hypothetical protein L211DRAFT_448050 [Terfezia boudieri ATCC MYA-4762]|uniref:Uncharacterized protein n=1 Tax=Terfezia boudieri ATCC MYA-4762 TaxID=1051890 RepID=A0A3N4LEH7_9PEZI|nr:hypothetical protein L211DRAFT_448050 [Terfezia boudieri ATCC MYA-4762]